MRHDKCKGSKQVGKERAKELDVALTWAQYWDLAAATRSFNTGWDWETKGVTAWMTAVNLEGGFKPETNRREQPNETLRNQTQKMTFSCSTAHPGAKAASHLTSWQNKTQVKSCCLHLQASVTYTSLCVLPGASASSFGDVPLISLQLLWCPKSYIHPSCPLTTLKKDLTLISEILICIYKNVRFLYILHVSYS